MRTPGQAPGSYFAQFEGGPWDGGLRGFFSTPPERLRIPHYSLGSYRRASMSELPPDEDLTEKNLARGALYRWEASHPT